MEKTKPIIAIIGTGLMGSGFATLCIYNHFPAMLIGRTEESCLRGINSVRQNLSDFITLGLIDESQIDSCLTLLSTSTDYRIIENSDVVFEAVQEVILQKQEVYKEIERTCPANTMIVSMTSSLSPDLLSSEMNKPERFIVAHPWNPPHLAPCVELVRSDKTNDETAARIESLLKRLNREVILLRKNIEGFIGNRIQHAMFREALYLIENGVATAEEIDRTVLTSFGQRYAHVGLMEYYDSVGLDLQYNVQSYLFPTLCNAKGPQKVLLDSIESNNLGLKTGKGIIDWQDKDVNNFRSRKNIGFYKFLNPYRDL